MALADEHSGLFVSPSFVHSLGAGKWLEFPETLGELASSDLQRIRPEDSIEGAEVAKDESDLASILIDRSQASLEEFLRKKDEPRRTGCPPLDGAIALGLAPWCGAVGLILVAPDRKTSFDQACTDQTSDLVIDMIAESEGNENRRRFGAGADHLFDETEELIDQYQIIGVNRSEEFVVRVITGIAVNRVRDIEPVCHRPEFGGSGTLFLSPRFDSRSVVHTPPLVLLPREHAEGPGWLSTEEREDEGPATTLGEQGDCPAAREWNVIEVRGKENRVTGELRHTGHARHRSVW